MFYPNLIKSRLKYKTYKFDSFENGIQLKTDSVDLPFGSCAVTYNFDYSTGALKDGLGMGPLDVIVDNHYKIVRKTINMGSDKRMRSCHLLRRWDFKHNMYMSDLIGVSYFNKVYINFINVSNPDWTEMFDLPLTQTPISLYVKNNGRDSLIFYSEADGLFLWDIYEGVATRVENAPEITSMCIHNDRLFATIDGDGRSIIFSEELNPLNFNVSDEEGGYINMDDNLGKCNKVVSFNGYLYAFRDYNIARISESKDRNVYNVEQITVGNGKIYAKTVAICGDKIIFLAADGLYEFNGRDCKKIDLEFDGLIGDIDNHYAIGEFFNGVYYLACTTHFEDGNNCGCENNAYLQNNCLITLRLSDYSTQILRGVDVRQMTPLADGRNNCLIAAFAYSDFDTTLGLIENCGNVQGEKLVKYWRSHPFDFNEPNKTKLIKELTFTTKTDLVLELYLDNKVKKFNIKGNELSQTIKINEKAKSVAFGFLTEEANVYISRPQVKIGVYE